VRRITIVVLSAGIAVGLYLRGGVRSGTQAPISSPPAQVAVYGHRVVNVYPHDRGAFTQGLLFHDGYLYESTGLNGESSLRKVVLETGEVVDRFDLGEQYFGEGLALSGSRLLQLTWRSGLGFIYDLPTFSVVGTFTYSGEGWGLTNDASTLMLSDGSSSLRFLDPATFEELGSVTVRDGGAPVEDLNELEYIDGQVYANIWQTDRVAIIDPTTGRVNGWIDLRGLLSAGDAVGGDAVLNGIAYDAATGRLFVTGKLWPKLFEIELVER
jgi:glutamine cyclotransferase